MKKCQETKYVFCQYVQFTQDTHFDLYTDGTRIQT